MHRRNKSVGLWFVVCCYVGILTWIIGLNGVSTAAAQQVNLGEVPGTVIAHQAASTGKYVGSPSIMILPNGDYLASHDVFGPGSNPTHPHTYVYRSTDQGRDWRQIATIAGQYWSTLFEYQGAVYLMGTSGMFGNVYIRKSTNEGRAWTTPSDGDHGVLLKARKPYTWNNPRAYHTAPTPVIEHNGRLWRAMEYTGHDGGWPRMFGAFMMSAPVGSNILEANNWTRTNAIYSNKHWLPTGFNGWLEGNAVIDPSGDVVDVLRVDTPRGHGGKAAIINIDTPKQAHFDPENGIINMPGGAKKFTISYDKKSGKYWSLVNIVSKKAHKEHPHLKPGSIRNQVALICSPDLRHWKVDTFVLRTPDVLKHGFQYIDWQFDGNDIVFVSRTAFNDGLGGAHSYHDANFLTFHRLKGFRHLTMKDSVPMPALHRQNTKKKGHQ